MEVRSTTRLVTGRERRQDDRQWVRLRSMVRDAGHEGHTWRGMADHPTGHMVAWLYVCDTCSEPLFATTECSRRPCRECFPEGLLERLVAWWNKRR